TDGDGSHGSTSKTPSYTKSVSWHHYLLREPSAEAWLRWQEIVKAKDDETPLSVAERARRNLEADVELFIDVLCDTGLQPVFSEDDREQVIAVYGPVHARLLRQSLELISDAGEVKKK
ncbi:phage tail assembly chaperone, partial [Escherichia coli]|nr:phage tail assembly chaperone [Escherichia coli]